MANTSSKLRVIESLGIPIPTSLGGPRVPSLAYFATDVVADGVADQTGALQTIHDGMPDGGIVLLPAGKIVVNGTLNLTHPITWLGQGTSTDWDTTSDAAWAPATEIVRATGTGTILAIGTGTPVGGIRLAGFGIDGATKAATGIVGDQLQGVVLQDVSVRRCTSYTMVLKTTTATANVGTFHNRFDSVHLRGANGLKLLGNAGHTANVCHNTFTDLLVVFSGTRGLLLTDADNNTFVGTRLYRSAGTGIGLELGAYARANYFLHLEASAGGVQVDTPHTTGKSNLIVGYDVENGQPLPTFQTGARLDYTVTGVSSSWMLGSNLVAGMKSVSVTAAHTVQPTESLILANGTFTVAPTATEKAGRTYTVKNIGTGTVTVGSGGHSIDGASTYSLATQYSAVTLQFDGTNFHVIGKV